MRLPAFRPGRSGLAGLLALGLTVLTALPAPAGTRPRIPSKVRPAPSWKTDVFWVGALSAIPDVGKPLAFWLAARGGVDPDGQPYSEETPLGDSGCGADPNGNPTCSSD
jgi:hypothetical protein